MRQFNCPKCGQRYDPPYPDDIHRVASIVEPKDGSSYFETAYECLNCHHSIRLYWLEGNPNQSPRQIATPVTEALRRHRQRLNESVFIPLRDHVGGTPVERGYGAEWAEAKFSFNMSHIRKSPYFADALKHLSIDIPRYPMWLTQMEMDSFKLSKKVERFQKGIEQTMRDRLSFIAPEGLGPDFKGVISYNLILSYGYARWFTLLHAYLDPQNRRTFSLETVANIAPPTLDWRKTDNKHVSFTISGQVVGELDAEKGGLLFEIVKPFLNDVTAMKRILRFIREKASLQTRAQTFSAELNNKVIHRIEDEQYNTFAECCKNVIASVEKTEGVK